MEGKKLFKTLVPLLFIVMSSIHASAQGKNIWPIKPVTINGTSDEWAHPLANYNSSTKLSFAIANDRSNLYILIESADQPTNTKILTNSITVSINSKGKKRAVTSITFPIIEREDLYKSRQPFRAGRDERPVSPTSDNTQNNDILSKANTIKISGFYKIPDGTFSSDLVNTYGIKAAASIDQKKVLIYELSIPLSKLNISLYQKKSVAYNIKINGSSNPISDSYGSNYPGIGRTPGTGRGIPTIGGGGIIGIGGGMPRLGGTIRIGGGQTRPGGQTRSGGQNGSSRTTVNFRKDNINTKPVDFWVKYTLAKTKL